MSTIACWPRQLLLMLGLCLSPSTLAATLLANALWQVQIDPATLAVQVTPADRASVCIEPYTCVTDAINLRSGTLSEPDGLIESPPGGTYRAEMAWEIS